MRTTAALTILLFSLGLLAVGCPTPRRDNRSGDDDDDSAPGDDDDDDATTDDDDDGSDWPPLPEADQYANCTAEITRDADGDGDVDGIGSEEFDDGGYWLLYDWDLDGDGDTDWIQEATRDSGHRIWVQEVTGQDDPSADILVTFDYDDDGNMSGWERDEGNDGSLDEIVEQEWDGDDLVLFRRDDGGNGSWDITQWLYYAGGDLIRIEMDNSADGIVDFIGEVDVNSAGNTERIDWEDSSGEPVALLTWSFSNPEYWELYRYDDGADGLWDTQEMHGFDSQWRMTLRQEDEGDGWMNIYEYDYDCP